MNNYEFKEKYWVVSEVKASLVEVYNNFLNKKDIYIRSLKGVTEKIEAKAEYTASLYGFYCLMLNGFTQHLKDNKDEPKYTEDDYINLALSNDHDDEKLVRMGYLLEKWAWRFGAFRITHQEKVYDDPLDQMQEEDDM
jgi:hypothetical protein